ncbi:MAG: helix-turn-helix transcriptional regulator [Candidatus Latescibacteria bacterium]|jgi:transcriptional regulator with XRE-family HTH domain|nr:helix-turn-helix transcriptional regulator [Candidatus Latescibacterota bacterium]MBT5830794.1 helix-turn-helix transcriptional regulator [Candidatus Latescibacterota bacterium]
MESVSNEVGARIKEIRRSMQMSQKELAKRTGLTQSWISRYERGGQIPGAKKMADFGRALNVPVSAFFQETAHLSGIMEFLNENLRNEEKEDLFKVLSKPMLREKFFKILRSMADSPPAVEGLLDNLILIAGPKA